MPVLWFLKLLSISCKFARSQEFNDVAMPDQPPKKSATPCGCSFSRSLLVVYRPVAV